MAVPEAERLQWCCSRVNLSREQARVPMMQMRPNLIFICRYRIMKPLITYLTVGVISIHAFWGCHLCRGGAYDTSKFESVQSCCGRLGDNSCDDSKADGKTDDNSFGVDDDGGRPLPCNGRQQCRFLDSNRLLSIANTRYSIAGTAMHLDHRASHDLQRQFSLFTKSPISLAHEHPLRERLQVWRL